MLSRRKRIYIHDLNERVNVAKLKVKEIYMAYVNGEATRDQYLLEVESCNYECRLLQKALQE